MSDVEHVEQEQEHPSPSQYVKVAVVLCVITAAEVAIYYVGALRALLVPMLLVFSAAKFLLVVLWFMHLRFDSPVFRRLFLMGLVLTVSVFLIVLLNFFLRGGATPAPPSLTG